MKRLFLLCITVLLSSTLFAQVSKKPTIMLLPSDHWCSARYFTKTFDNQGVKQVINDYDAAFREDAELSQVVSKVGELMTRLGYDLKDYAMENRAVNDRLMEEQTLQSRSGGMVVETPVDMLRRSVKYDIELCVDWDVISESGKKAVRFTLEAFDTYTSKRIATATGLSKPSSKGVAYQIEDAVASKIKTFNDQLKTFLKKQEVNGREIRLSVLMWDTSYINLEDEFDDKELLEHIVAWMQQNTVNSSFSLSMASESRAVFEQVMVDRFDENGMPLDARAFASKLRKYLRKAPFSLDAKVDTRGLGEAILVIGEK